MSRSKNIAKKALHLFPESIFTSSGKVEDWMSTRDVHRPLVVELGMGRGAMLVSMAQTAPHKDFMGVEVKEERCVHMAKRARSRGLLNIHGYCGTGQSIYSVLQHYPCDDLWITFPDPWPRKGQKHRRFVTFLTIPHIVALVKPGGRLLFKTDHLGLYEDTDCIIRHSGLQVVHRSSDLHNDKDFSENVMTTFEKRYHAEGKPIYLLVAQKGE